jgi:hypothetical protein
MHANTHSQSHSTHTISLTLSLTHCLTHTCTNTCTPPLPGEIKGELIKVVTDMVLRHQEARAQVTEAVVDAFMAVRPMNLV